MKEIIQKLPPDIQDALLSATMPPEILEMTQKFMRNPVQILVKNEQLTLDGIKQFYVSIAKDEWKFDILVKLYKNVEIGQCMILANKKERVSELANKLKALNFVISETHGDMRW
jgi:superfamily II DNA/RNA helicase